MATVFLSYSRSDKTKAVELFDRLCVEGYSCWIDEAGINPATQWSKEIAKAIDECIVFIILLSENALDSENVIKELSLASEGKKHIIPVNLEPIELSHGVKYQLAGLQRVDYKDYERIERAVRTLLSDSDKSSAEKIATVITKPLRSGYARSISLPLWKKLSAIFSVLLIITLVYVLVIKKDHLASSIGVMRSSNVKVNTLYGEAVKIFVNGSKPEFEHAINLLDTAEKLDPHFTAAFELRGIMFKELGNDEDEKKDRSIRIGVSYTLDPNY